MDDKIFEKVKRYADKHRMIAPGDTVVAGVSGGADSVCLFLMLCELAEEIDFHLAVVHVNHKIRPEAAADAAYVEELCKSRNIPFILEEKDVKEYAGEKHLSEEEAGREVRYQAFEEALGKYGSCSGEKEGQGRIAVAHNANDRAETMLFHLFRGTGLSGMCGIRPVNGQVVRPLLCLSRKEIESWLEERKISFCTDSTNSEDIYTRNRIRRHILPYAEQEICRGAAAHMNRTAEQLMEAEAYITRQTKAAMERCVQDKEGRGIRINIPAFFREDEYLQGRILLECVAEAAGSRKDITAVHVESAAAILGGSGNKEASLPYGLVVYKEYDWGMIQKREEKKGPEAEERYELSAGVRVEIPGLGIVESTVFPRKESQNIPEKTYTKWFDYDKITSSVVFRHRQKGDYLTINSKMGRKSLQDYFVNEKVPEKERDKRFVLADGAHLLWVPGLRISEYYKITENTRNILQVSVADKEE